MFADEKEWRREGNIELLGNLFLDEIKYGNTLQKWEYNFPKDNDYANKRKVANNSWKRIKL